MPIRTLAALGLIAAPLTLAGQTATTARKEPLKPHPVVVRMRSSCPATVAQAAAPTDAQKRDARDLAQRARQSSILGDAPAALSQLRDAAALDPTEPNIAYELGRAYETTARLEQATQEYCRFLSLSPSSSEAADIREHVATLSPPRPDTIVSVANAAFNRAADAYDKGQLIESEAYFNTAIHIDSMTPEAYYDRGLVRSIRGEREEAAVDYERYLRLRPEALDRVAVVARINALRAQRLSAAQALGLGLVLPGGGQFYTNRPGRGLLSIAGVGAAVVIAVLPRTTTTTTTQTSTDPFGNKYSFPVTTQHKSKPYLMPGLAAAAGIALVSAVDASHYARTYGSRAVSLSIGPNAGGVGVLASLALP